MTDRGATSDAVERVVESIVRYLTFRHRQDPLVVGLLGRLADVDRDQLRPPSTPAHNSDLEDVLTQLDNADDNLLVEVGDALRAASGELAWQIDDGNYYRPGAAVSDTYRQGNMNAPLVEGDDFAMGLFLLRPGVDYADHRHQAPEFYLNLTGPTQWRFDFGPWHEMEAGSLLWNEPWQVHATRTGTTPWLSCWAWMCDIDQLCEVVPSRDAVERQVQTNTEAMDGTYG